MSDEKYPELRLIVSCISMLVCSTINEEVEKVKSKMPYKAQWVLEELVKDLQGRV